MADYKRKRLKKASKPKEKTSCFKSIFRCMFKTSKNENCDLSDDSAIIESQSKTHTNDDDDAQVTQVSIAPKKISSSCMTDPDPPAILLQKTNEHTDIPKNLEMQQIRNTHKQRLEQITRSPFTTSNGTANSENKNLTDQLVRTILGKYLVMKRIQQDDNPTPVDEVPQVAKRDDRHQLHVEYFDISENSTQASANLEAQDKASVTDDKLTSTSNAETATYSQDDEEEPKPKGDFPAKTKSAPTNSTARDSLADICTKYSHFNPNDSCSEDYESYTDESSSNCKKKLELIFDKSSEEILASSEDGPPLQYTISCENTPVYTGTHRQDSVLHKFERSYEHLREVRRLQTITSQELRIQPSAMGEFNGYTDSTDSTSLKWKLIISHHKDLK